ncbi:hypothetical protein Acid345_3280 [Candidatus Koribacter versatilis Ellin345]|uniref:Lipoprotein n=1 Tax=Koribacter versatilis (strain Ellin345) TaxID=204669 RepID=Q1ILG9_KORVE|nr:hypothetical protein [Candidatus Koribacter versatilis]ABF42281.1 hypothetical protein Acid345_3280 [Candidatus Koribacter versatilis Ellin345]
MKRVWLWAGLVAIALGGCAGLFIYRDIRTDSGEYQTPGKLERRISANIDACDAKAECLIQLKDVTSFEWDEAHVFDDHASRSDIEKVLHAPFPQYKEMSPAAVFMKDGKVVYSEAEAWHLEKAAVNSVTWDPKDVEHFRKYARDAEFIATRRSFEKGYLYELNSTRP